MKILILHQYFNTPDNPGSIRSYELLRHWKEKGVDATVITTNYYLNYEFKGLYKKVQILDSNVYVLNTRFNQKSSKFARILGFAIYVLFSFGISLFQKFDVLFATSTPITIAVPALLVSSIKSRPLVFEVRDLWPLIPYKLGYLTNERLVSMMFKLEELAYKRSKHVVFLSSDMKDISKERYPQIKTPFSVIENMASTDLFAKCALTDLEGVSDKKLLQVLQDETVLKIGYLGTIGFVNNCEYLVKLAQKIEDAGIRIKVIIVGDGSEKGDVIKLIEKNAMQDTVLHFPPIAKRLIPVIYKNLDYSISTVRDVPELAANSANKFFDTLAAGTPILINHEGWQANFIKEHNVGYVLRYDLGNVLDFLDFNKHFDKKLNSDRIAQLASEKFSSKVQSNKYLRIFANLT